MRLRGTMEIGSQGHLFIGGCDTVDLAPRYGTPLYVIDEEHLRARCRRYREAFARADNAEVIYAGKAFLTTAICRIIEEEGLSLDVASGGELHTALRAGFPPSRIYFHGNNKSPSEIRMALEAGIHRFMVDNLYELELISRATRATGRKAHICLRLTPGIEAHTHKYIMTGQIDSKFGLPIETGQALEGVRQALASPGVELHGLHCHIGSQIFETAPFAAAARALLEFAHAAYRATGWVPEEINLGGGLGVYYAEGDAPPSIEDYANTLIEAVSKTASELGMKVPRILVEPGRSIVSPAGTTLYTVGAVKEIRGVRTYVTVDGGMGDNLRPALYQARYEAAIANKMHDLPGCVVTIAGKYCESGDILVWNAGLPVPEPGDLIAIPCTGAYNYAMAMNYNRFPRPAVITVYRGRPDVIVMRESYEDLIRNDIIPPRLQREEARWHATRLR
ncbi:MAG: diaminopimelate decarboxylase [Desulfotomaculales bacterium]